MGVVKVYGVDTVTVKAAGTANAEVGVSQGVTLFSAGNVFTVTYERTKLSEIREALKRGKVCVCEYNGVLCWMDSSSGLAEEAFFAGVADGGGSGKVLIQCVSMAEVDGSTAWINWTVDPMEKPDNIFRVEAFYTSYDELAREYRAGKLCVCRYANRDYILGYMPAGYYGYAKFYVNDEYGFNILQLMAGTNDWSVVEKPYPGGDVDSVNGKTGEVVLTAEDVHALPDDTVIPSLDGYATEAYVDDHHDDTKMDSTNPVGYGSFSLNRMPDSDVGRYSFAEGEDTTASGDSSHAEGTSTTAEGKYSHAEGHQTTASGSSAHAEGYQTTASGARSHAEGQHTIASGNCAHAEGYYTAASAHRSHAEGYHTTASALNQHTQGKFNVEDTAGAFADIVGWGDDEDHLKNISSLTTEGDLHLAGDVYVGANADGTGGTKLGAGGASAWDDLTDKPFDTIDENTLIVRDGVLAVNTTDAAEQDNTKPITSSGVHVIVGNIDTLLSLI